MAKNSVLLGCTVVGWTGFYGAWVVRDVISCYDRFVASSGQRRVKAGRELLKAYDSVFVSPAITYFRGCVIPGESEQWMHIHSAVLRAMLLYGHRIPFELQECGYALIPEGRYWRCRHRRCLRDDERYYCDLVRNWYLGCVVAFKMDTGSYKEMTTFVDGYDVYDSYFVEDRESTHPYTTVLNRVTRYPWAFPKRELEKLRASVNAFEGFPDTAPHLNDPHYQHHDEFEDNVGFRKAEQLKETLNRVCEQ